MSLDLVHIVSEFDYQEKYLIFELARLLKNVGSIKINLTAGQIFDLQFMFFCQFISYNLRVCELHGLGFR